MLTALALSAVLIHTASTAALPSDRLRSENARGPSPALLLGDSQAEGVQNSGVLGAVGIDIHSFPGKPTSFFLDWMHAHPQELRERTLIILQMGGNDISIGSGEETIARNLQLLATFAREQAPSARVVVASIPVRGQWFDARRRYKPAFVRQQERTLDRINDWIESGVHPQFDTFSVNTIVADPVAPRLQRAEFKRAYRADVHLNGFGYRAVANAMRNQLLVPASEAADSLQ